jgi:hypothetical protein
MVDDEARSPTGIGEGIGKAGTTVKEGIIGSLRGINEIEAEMVSLVRGTISNTLRATGAVTSESVDLVRDVVKGAIQATEEIGGGAALPASPPKAARSPEGRAPSSEATEEI